MFLIIQTGFFFIFIFAISVPGLNKVAKKLGIDCAPAMVGFDYHSGGSHPMYDGYVVCEEFKESIVEAWEQVFIYFLC